ncbi:hypothetical protein ACFWOT_09030 [Streptomyces sp. NPDC058440]|uniref:hypothetical protein n=1 Tax=Streptomyces sp. NPDC058440 TaxID=3346501 RepID=UPI00365E5A28
MHEICTHTLARVHPFRRRQATAILLEWFRLNRQDFRRGTSIWGFRPYRKFRPLPIVAAPVMDGYGSRYPSPRLDMGRPMGSYPHDLV